MIWGTNIYYNFASQFSMQMFKHYSACLKPFQMLGHLQSVPYVHKNSTLTEKIIDHHNQNNTMVCVWTVHARFSGKSS